MCALLLCGGTYMYMLLWCVGAKYPGVHCGSDPPSRTRHPVASGLQPTHQPGCATDVVAIATPTPSVSNAVVNLTIGGVLSLRDNESCKAHLAEH
jgi:hypothetical protein